MNTLNERIKKLRKALDLTQQEFADKLCIKRNTVATYETGKSNPSDAAVILICKTFNVSEAWLRTGEGEMFVQRTEDDELAAVFSAIAASDGELIKRIIRAYLKLDDKEKAAVKKLIDGFTPDSSGPAAPAFAFAAPEVIAKTETTPPVPATSGQERTGPDLAAKVAELERQNRELAAKVAAMEEEELAADFREAFSALQSGLAGNSDQAQKKK